MSTSPVTVGELKAHARIDLDNEDTLLASLLESATEWCQSFQGRQYLTATRTIRADTFAGRIVLPGAPLSTVTSITYVDETGTTQTLATTVYQVVTSAQPGYVCLAYNQTWPATRTQPDAVTVTYTCGYGEAAAVPFRIKQAILLLAANWYANREAIGDTVGQKAVLPFAVDSLLWQDRVFGLSEGRQT